MNVRGSPRKGCSLSFHVLIKRNIEIMPPIKQSLPLSFLLISVTEVLATSDITAAKSRSGPRCPLDNSREATGLVCSCNKPIKRLSCGKGADFCPCHFSIHCLNRNKGDLSWGFAKPVVIINLLLSVKRLGRRSHGKRAPWTLGLCQEMREVWGCFLFHFLY